MTTATCNHITRDEALSEQEAMRQDLARFVHKITNNCKTIAQKYQDFVDGEYPDAKPYLIYKANERLDLMAGAVPDDAPTRAIRQEDAPKPQKPKITTKEIVNWDTGRYIRQATDNGRKLITHLDDMTQPRYVFPSANPDELKHQKATQIKPHHEFAAAEELFKRGYGSQNPYAYYPTTSAREERILQDQFANDLREKVDGISLVTYMLHVIDNPKFNAWNEIITTPYTQTQRLRAIKHLLWRGIDVAWDHITHDDIEQYYRGLDEKQRQETERVLAESERKPPTPLTPEQEASVLALLDQTHRQAERAERKAAKKAHKKAKKAAKKEAKAKADALDSNNPTNRNNGNGNSADANANNADANNGESAAIGNNADAANGESAANYKNADATDKNSGNDNNKNGENGNSDGDTTRADAPISDRGATAVANALARNPNVDLDTALENHHATAGIPKQNLTHEQIYDAITAEANFQKRQAIIQNRLRQKNPNAPEDDPDPKSRSP